MKTLPFILGEPREIKAGELYCLGQICDGGGDVESLLDSRIVFTFDEESRGAVWHRI